MIALLEGRGSFAGHETFPFRYQWLHKAVREVDRDPEIFLAEDAMVRLGVGKNMVKSIRHWGLVTGILDAVPNPEGGRMPRIKVSDLGRRLLGRGGWDPFLEDPASLWLVHWELCSRPEDATTWYWVFNHLPQPEFTKTELTGWLMALVEERGWSRISEKSLGRDVDCFLRCYVPVKVSRTVSIEDVLDCPLVELGLIREFGGRGSYFLDRADRPTLPDMVFAYALATFLNAYHGSVRTVPLDSLAYAPGGPGRIFSLSEDALLHRLERIDGTTGGSLVYDDTAGLRQVLIKERLQPIDLLHKHYAAVAARGAAKESAR